MKKLLMGLAALASASGGAAQTAYVFLAPGFEEIEVVNTVDVLRRADIPVVEVSMDAGKAVKGATGQTIVADVLFTEINPVAGDWLIIPGGMPGASNLQADMKLGDMLKAHNAAGGKIASICAGPAVVLGPLGLLRGHNATCYPSLRESLAQSGGIYQNQPVVVDGTLITSQGPGTAIPFALAIVAAEKGKAVSDSVAEGLLVEPLK